MKLGRNKNLILIALFQFCSLANAQTEGVLEIVHPWNKPTGSTAEVHRILSKKLGKIDADVWVNDQQRINLFAKTFKKGMDIGTPDLKNAKDVISEAKRVLGAPTDWKTLKTEADKIGIRRFYNGQEILWSEKLPEPVTKRREYYITTQGIVQKTEKSIPLPGRAKLPWKVDYEIVNSEKTKFAYSSQGAQLLRNASLMPPKIMPSTIKKENKETNRTLSQLSHNVSDFAENMNAIGINLAEQEPKKDPSLFRRRMRTARLSSRKLVWDRNDIGSFAQQQQRQNELAQSQIKYLQQKEAAKQAAKEIGDYAGAAGYGNSSQLNAVFSEWLKEAEAMMEIAYNTNLDNHETQMKKFNSRVDSYNYKTNRMLDVLSKEAPQYRITIENARKGSKLQKWSSH